MKIIKEYFKDEKLSKYTFFVLFNVIILTIAYFIIKNMGYLLQSTGNVLDVAIKILTPLLIGLTLAYIINPLVEFLNLKFLKHNFAQNKPKRSRYLSILITFLIIIVIAFAIIYAFIVLLTGDLVVGNLSKLVSQAYDLLINYEKDIQSWVLKLENLPFSNQINNAINTSAKWFANTISATNLINWAAGFGGTIINFVIGLIISIYLLVDKEFFIKMWNNFLNLVFPSTVKTSINQNLHDVDNIISQFLRGMLLDALIVAILSSIGLTLSGLQFGVFIGIFAGVANIIPYFGPIAGMIPAFFVGWLTDNIWQGVIAVVVLIVIQQIDGNIIYPKIVGSQTGLKPLFVLLAVSIMGSLFGIKGMIIAVPIAGIFKLFITKWANSKAKKLNLELK